MSKALVILSGGLDSTTALRLAVNEYDEVHAISFDYNQKQSYELECAKKSCELLNVTHKIVNLSFLGDIAKVTSTNIKGSCIKMPTASEVTNNKQPVTYVPNRNMILLSISASYAETMGITDIICGFQSQDTYGYFDTTQSFLNKINSVLSENRSHTLQVKAPFIGMSKSDEIEKVYELDGNTDLFKNTLTCYNPQYNISCGVCPSCSERLTAFKSLNLVDPILYKE